MKYFISFLLLCAVFGLQAQQPADSLQRTKIGTVYVPGEDTVFVTKNPAQYTTSTKEKNTGDMYQGFTKKVTYDKMIPPYGIEVTFDKSVHIIFPAPIRYVDLGDENILAGIAGDASNVLRLKAAIEFWEGETNMAVITENGSFYSFNIKYAIEPEILNIEMQDFVHDGSSVNRPNNSMEIYLKELNNETPAMVNMVMKAIYNNNKRLLKHIGSKSFGLQFTLKGIYSYNGLLYLHTEIKNSTNVSFAMDYLSFNIVDKKLVRRVTMQETPIKPVRSFNFMSMIKGKTVENSVFVFPVFTIPKEKKMKVVLHEKNGGRHQAFDVINEDLEHAKEITDFIIE
jgi:conjugative transposon TraN protein